MKYLIINADDFWYSRIFNDSILELIETKLISSTTAMVNHINKNQQKQVDKIKELKNTHNVSIGLHLEFNNSNYKEEVILQYDKFLKIFGFPPTHIDIHKPTWNTREKVAIHSFCEKYNIPCRNIRGENIKVVSTTHQCLNWTRLSFEDLHIAITKFKDSESYEILFHPGTYDKNCKSSLNKERETDIGKIKEINTKLDANNIRLISYKELPELES